MTSSKVTLTVSLLLGRRRDFSEVGQLSIVGGLEQTVIAEHRGQHDPDDGCILFSVGHEPRSGQASGSQVRLPFKQEHFSLQREFISTNMSFTNVYERVTYKTRVQFHPF